MELREGFTKKCRCSPQFRQLVPLFLNTNNVDLSDIQNDSLSKILLTYRHRREKTPFVDQKCTYEKVTKNLGRALPLTFGPEPSYQNWTENLVLLISFDISPLFNGKQKDWGLNISRQQSASLLEIAILNCKF